MADIDAKTRARAWVLSHPDESKAVQAAGANVSEGTIAAVRRDLIAEGKLPASRKSRNVSAPPENASSDIPAAPAPPPGMLDHAAMLALADIADLEDLDDEEIQKRMLKQCIRFAFDTKLHADTRMSASNQWAKLRDQVKAKDLGPGFPMKRTDALARYKDLTASIGDIDLCVQALFAAYPIDQVVAAISLRLDAQAAATPEPTSEGTPV